MAIYKDAKEWLEGVIIDEDDMVSDSATDVPSQQSVKKYTDDGVAEAKSYTDDELAALDFATEGFVGTAVSDAVGDIVVSNGYLEWDAVVYDIAYQPAITLTVLPLINGADWASMATDGSGSTGVACLSFEATAEESALGAWTPPKTWKGATTITPVVRFFTKSAGSAGQRAVWGLEYTILDTAGTVGNTTIVTAETIAPADTDYTANKLYAVVFPDIDMSGYALGTEPTITYRLFRDATDAGDDFPADVFMTDLDFLFRVFRNGCEASEF